MAFVIRYTDAKTRKVKRVKTLKRPTGIFLSRVEAEKQAQVLRSQQNKLKQPKIIVSSIAVQGASIPVPAPKFVKTDYSESYGHNARKVIVLHSTESHDHAGVSDVAGIGAYLDGKGYGVHCVVDGEGNVGRFAREQDLVYHAAGANSFGIGIEQIGFARWDTKQWLFGPTRKGKLRKQLQTVAHLIAYIADRNGIPLTPSTVHGIATHRQFPEGGHTDPGAGYPLGYVLKQARKIRAQYRGTK